MAKESHQPTQFVGVVATETVFETEWAEELVKEIPKEFGFLACGCSRLEVWFANHARTEGRSVTILFSRPAKRGARASAYPFLGARGFVERCSEIYVCVPLGWQETEKNHVAAIVAEARVSNTPLFTRFCKGCTSAGNLRRIEKRRDLGGGLVMSIIEAQKDCRYRLVLRKILPGTSKASDIAQHHELVLRLVNGWTVSNNITDYFVGDGFLSPKLGYDEKRRVQYIEVVVHHSIRGLHKIIFIH